MPNDENNGVTSQNQQVNPNGDGMQGNQNMGMFSDTPNYQVVGQGRTGMFKTPDEQLDANQQQLLQTDMDDSFFADIDPNDVPDDSESLDLQDDMFAKESNTPKENLDKEIEHMISFDDSQDNIQLEDNNESQVNNEPQQQILDSSSQSSESNPEVSSQGSSEASSQASSQESSESSDDWLQQEDKEVENAFGSQDVPETDESVNVNQSSEDVAQTVENLIVNQDENIPENNDTYTPDENEYSQMSNLLDSSGAGQVDLNDLDAQSAQDNNTLDLGQVATEQSAGQTISDQATSEQSIPEQIQSQAEQVQSQSEQIVQEQANNSSLSTESVAQDLSGISSTFGAPFEVSNDVEVSNNTETQGTVSASDTVGNAVADNVGTQNTFDISRVDSSSTNQNVGFGIGSLNEEMSDSQSLVGQPVINNQTDNNPFNLDSIENDIQNLSVGSQIIQQEAQNLNQPQVHGQVSADQSVQGSVTQQSVQAHKKKKQSGFIVIGIFFGVILLLGILGYVAAKMFPDKFDLKNIFGGGKIVEYIDNSGIIGSNEEGIGNEEGFIDDENILSGDISELNEGDEDFNEDENLGTLDDVVSIENESGENENLDPNSLAALLSDDGSGSESLLTGTDLEENGNGDIVSQDDISNQEGNTESNIAEFDPFAEVDDLLSNNDDNKRRLEDYLTKGELYNDLGTLNENPVVARYGEYLMVTAQAQLTKLENGEEIDTTLFDKFDEVLVKIADLLNN